MSQMKILSAKRFYSSTSSSKKIKGVLLDMNGVFHTSWKLVPGQVEALQRFRRLVEQKDLKFKFLTNTTRSPVIQIAEKMRKLGYQIDQSEIISSSMDCKDLITKQKLKPFMLIYPDLEPEFQEHVDRTKLYANDPSKFDSVVIGDAADSFSFENVNNAFRVLMHSKTVNKCKPFLISMGFSKYKLAEDGKLSLTLGPYAKLLEFATGTYPCVTGKPSEQFFLRGVNALGCKPSEVVMIGDDMETDVCAAQQAGLQGVLVLTGKTKKTDAIIQTRYMKPDAVLEDFNKAVDWIQERC